jgi:murein DD-endopeptidase MepM/ murein hydrolase activator NlpD
MKNKYDGFITIVPPKGSPPRHSSLKKPVVPRVLTVAKKEQIIDDYRFVYSPLTASFFVKEMNEQFKANPTLFTAHAHAIAAQIAQKANAYSLLPAVRAMDATLGQAYSMDYRESILSFLAQANNAPGLAATSDLLAVRIPSPDADLVRSLADPVTIATIYALNSLTFSSDELRDDVIMHYLSLAHAESGYDSNAASSSSSSKGQLQINDSTYRGALSVIRLYGPWAKSYAPIFISHYFTSFPPSFGWRDFNRLEPDRDSLQYLANTGIMLDHLSSVNDNWYFLDGWKGKLGTTNQRYFEAKFPHLLRKRDVGRQALITYYHINGSGADHIRGVAYPDRYKSDAEYFDHVKSIPGFIDFIKHVAGISIGAITAPAELPKIFSTAAIANNVLVSQYKIKGNFVPSGSPIVTSKYGDRPGDSEKGISKHHKGVDLRAAIGTPVFAVDDGTIVSHYSKPGFGWGLSITLKSAFDGAVFRYAHMSKLFARPDERVKKGQIIGLSGSSGTTSPHLHFEFTLPSVGRVNPLTDAFSRWKQAI